MITTHNNTIKDVQKAFQHLNSATSSEIIEQYKSVTRELQAKTLQIQRNYWTSKNASDENDLELYLKQASNFHQQVLDIMTEGTSP